MSAGRPSDTIRFPVSATEVCFGFTVRRFMRGTMVEGLRLCQLSPLDRPETLGTPESPQASEAPRRTSQSLPASSAAETLLRPWKGAVREQGESLGRNPDLAPVGRHHFRGMNWISPSTRVTGNSRVSSLGWDQTPMPGELEGGKESDK